MQLAGLLRSVPSLIRRFMTVLQLAKLGERAELDLALGLDHFKFSG